MSPRLNISPDRLAEFCRHHGIAKLSLYGSAIRNDFRETSDLDVLVEFIPGRRVGLIRLAGIELELSALLNGRVDLRTPGDLSRYFRDEVLEQAQVQYVAA